jgi:hypothetical protein
MAAIAPVESPPPLESEDEAAGSSDVAGDEPEPEPEPSPPPVGFGIEDVVDPAAPDDAEEEEDEAAASKSLA